MSISMYDQTVAAMSRGLLNLDAILSRAEEYAREREIDPAILVQGRLFPDMFPLAAQVRIATDVAKGAAARLSGCELPSWADDEETFEELHARIRKALDFMATCRPEDFEGSEKKRIELKLPNETMEFDGREYVLGFVMPNFYFHVTTAYNILRHNGVPIGKRDFLGAKE